MVMAVNNAALLGGQAVVDTSDWAGQFRDGQKLRQEYEARQQQKALNEFMGIEDFNERIAKARTHKYAGALVPQLQQYEEARQKAALDNLRASADIGKVYGETGKLGAETSKIGAETQGRQIDNATGIKDYISAAAVSQDPKSFAVNIGELYKNQLLTESQAGQLLNMVNSDPANAAAVMQRMAMANPEIAKTFKPQAESVDAGDAIYQYAVNPFTGQAEEPNARIAKGASPDNVLDNETSRANNLNTTNASMYGTDVRSADTRYSADVASQDRRLKLNQDGQIEWFKADTARQNADTNRIKANKTGVNGGKPRSPTATKEMVKHKTNITNNAKTMQNTKSWIEKIKNGELELGGVSNLRNSLANRTGINSLGSNPAAYAEFKSAMVGLASDALRLNTGVQTDMDYKRALEEMQAEDYLPRNPKTAIALLEKIYRDFDSKNRSEYEAYAEYKREYDGVSMVGYDDRQGASNANNTKSKSKGASIIGGILGGK